MCAREAVMRSRKISYKRYSPHMKQKLKGDKHQSSQLIVMGEAAKDGPKVIIFLGRTVEGFNKFLTERNLNVIETEILALYVLDAMENFEKRDREASNLLIKEILTLTNVEDAETAVDVTRQFGKLCDTYRTLLQTLTGKENVMEKKDV